MLHQVLEDSKYTIFLSVLCFYVSFLIKIDNMLYSAV